MRGGGKLAASVGKITFGVEPLAPLPTTATDCGRAAAALSIATCDPDASTAG